MKRLISFVPSVLFGISLVLFLLLTACATVTPSPAQQVPTEISPTSIPATPAPAVINAPIVEAPALVTIQFLSPMDGWGVTETQIVRTNDGGVTWYNVTPPGLTEAGYSISLVTLDANFAWAHLPDYSNYPNSGILHRTTDGGISWYPADVPFSGGDVHFIDSINGWALADLGAGAGSNAVAVYQTMDGGISWTQTYINDPNSPIASDSLPLGGLKSDIVPVNMQTAFITGVTYASGSIYLYRSDDGGRTWMPVTLPIPAGTENAQMSIEDGGMEMTSPENGFIVVRVAGNGSQMAVYNTQDAGKTWTLTPTLIPDGGRAVFPSAQEAVIYNGTQFYITKDAARTWNIIPPDIVFADTLTGMDFANAASGWVVTQDVTGHRSFYRTSDGGLTWFPVVP